LPGRAFKFSDAPAPQDPYGISKAEAECGLREIASQTGMEVVIIRPPLVYGPGVKANFETLVRLVRKRLPLPLGAIHNLRSLVALDNLVDLIVTCLKHPQASNQTFMVSDGHDLSTTALLRGLANAMGRPAYLLPVPAGWLEIGFRLVGREPWAKRLCGNLQVDISHTCSTLGWHPPVSVAEGLLRTIKG
jgi:nucleoside-diphosphate-sugar epimerase